MIALTLIFVTQRSHLFHVSRVFPLALDGGWSPTLIALLLAAALFGDRREPSRDWPHWVGVLMVLWVTSRNLLGAIPMIQFAIMGM
jgi:hypothetical protein